MLPCEGFVIWRLADVVLYFTQNFAVLFRKLRVKRLFIINTQLTSKLLDFFCVFLSCDLLEIVKEPINVNTAGTIAAIKVTHQGVIKASFPQTNIMNNVLYITLNITYIVANLSILIYLYSIIFYKIRQDIFIALLTGVLCSS